MNKHVALIKLIIPALILISAFGCKKKESEPALAQLSVQTIQKLDSIINTEIQNNNLPGVMVGVWIPGRGDYVKAFGTANLQTGSPRNLTNQFRIASISKTFTGLRILQLYDEGLLDIDDKLSEYFPEFPMSDHITIRNLLNMNSGIKDYADHEFLHVWYDDPFMPFSMQTGMELSTQDSAEFYPAGDSVKYCNVNYTILGLIVEQVTGNTIQEEISDHIFTPLGMTNSLYPTDYVMPGELRGYSWNEGENKFDDKTELNPEVPNSAGAIISNIYDMKRYAKALYTGELISDSTHLEQITTLPMVGAPEWLQYGLGIVNFHGFYGHNGTIFGFSSEMYYLPEEDAVIIINVNRLDVDDQSKSANIFIHISKVLFPEYVGW